jgi:hypothetical protein
MIYLPISTEYIPPIITNIGKKRYAVMDGKWYEIGPTVTLELIRKHHQPQPIKKKLIKTFKVKSSNGKNEYTVTMSGGFWNCNCPSWKNPCKHINIAKSQTN